MYVSEETKTVVEMWISEKERQNNKLTSSLLFRFIG